MKIRTLFLGISLLFFLASCKHIKSFTSSKPIVDDMMITLSADDNRPVSFANKESAFYYTQSHLNNHPEHAYFEGLTISQHKIFNGYKLYLDNKPLDIKLSTLDVYPYKMVRHYNEGIEESFWMADSLNVLALDVKGDNRSGDLGISLKGLVYDSLSAHQNRAFFHTKVKPSVEPDYWVAVLPQNTVRLFVKDNIVSGKNTNGFLIAVAETREDAQHLAQHALLSKEKWQDERRSRIEKLVTDKNVIYSNNDTLQNALRWLNVTTDQLVTHQRGYGIYAGLPWFSEYWGRDEFISLQGACLVNGQFEVAKRILLSFAKHQDTNPKSPFYGRVPNIVKVGSEDYHTTDGTPRFVNSLLDYINYSGDTTIVKEVYPYVKHSIEGAIKRWIDKKGYLLHRDNETWMDARREPDKVSYSPRATRANDIQALWYKQLMTGVYFAKTQHDSKSAKRWNKLATKLKQNFANDFLSTEFDYLADHLDSLNQPNYQIRPNQLFAFDLLDNDTLKAKALRKCWEELVYPWGTSTLNQDDSFFHPFHLAWDFYHKDAAYHNGTVWPWLNGIVIQRMVEMNQVDKAFQLFQNANEQVLYKGCVGGLSENLDAFPHKGKSYPKLTGTYLQGWSNAEQLRVWSQSFLGIQPNFAVNKLTLKPRLPKNIGDVKVTVPLGKGTLSLNYEGDKDEHEYTYTFNKYKGDIILDIYPYEPVDITLDSDKSELKVNVSSDYMTLILSDGTDKEAGSIKLQPLQARIKNQARINQFFKGLKFCQPDWTKEYSVLKK